jgi:hypothetical protein
MGQLSESGRPRRRQQRRRGIGYEPADAGLLSSARFIKPLAGLVVALGYGVGMGTDIAFKLIRR